MLKRYDLTLDIKDCEKVKQKADKELSLKSLSALIRYLIKQFLGDKK